MFLKLSFRVKIKNDLNAKFVANERVNLGY
jgi:hypothetical protein